MKQEDSTGEMRMMVFCVAFCLLQLLGEFCCTLSETVEQLKVGGGVHNRSLAWLIENEVCIITSAILSPCVKIVQCRHTVQYSMHCLMYCKYVNCCKQCSTIGRTVEYCTLCGCNTD